MDDHLGEQLLRSVKDREEQAIVARRIQRTLEPVSVWVTAADEPVLVKVQNVQHLATPIRAQLADPLPAVELAGHAAADAGGGRGAARAALPLIPALEGLDRGWYAGRSAGPILPRTASSASPSAVRCCAARWRICMRAAGSCATQFPRRSSPKARSSSRRRCRCCRRHGPVSFTEG